MEAHAFDDLIARALAEDLGIEPERLTGTPDPGVLERDITSAACIPASLTFRGHVVAREEGVICGLRIASRTFEMLAGCVGEAAALDVEPLMEDGAAVAAGAAVMRVAGPARVVLAAERTALDFLMLLSGIATEASRWQQAAGETLCVFDTRKTIPGLRALSKYAVRIGGAHNHRMGLYDMVLIKDNHIALAGGAVRAIEQARRANPGVRIEVEVETPEQARLAARAGADIVMLDNMSDDVVREAVRLVREVVGHRCLVEVSGGVTIDRLPAIAAAGADMVSTSALALAAPLDIGLDEVASSEPEARA